MASIPETTKYSRSLAEAADLRWRRLGYRSKADYRRALERYDLMVQGPHDVTLSIANMPLDDQDRIDAGLLDLTRRGIGTRGSLFVHLIADIVKLGKDPTGDQIADLIRQVSAAPKKRPK